MAREPILRQGFGGQAGPDAKDRGVPDSSKSHQTQSQRKKRYHKGTAFFFGSGAGIRTQDPSVTRYPNISIRSGLYHSRPFLKGAGRGASHPPKAESTLFPTSHKAMSDNIEIVSEPSMTFVKAWLLIAISS